MTIRFNDKPMELTTGSTLADAIREAGMSGEGIATAVNGEVVPRDKRAERILDNGDQVLIIQAFYGG